MHKNLNESIDPESPTESLGVSPAALAHRKRSNQNAWCAKPNLEFDNHCDPENPKTILPKDISKATAIIRHDISITPLVRSKCCVQLGLDLYYKFESLNQTGSFHERGAMYVLHKLKEDQRRNGVYTASNGNWAMALAYRAHQLRVPVTVVVPEYVSSDVAEKIQEYGATVVIHGRNLDDAKKQAFALMHEHGFGIYINGYDHPHVIAAAGSIGIEILEQLPQTDVILVPVGGGGLIAGIASVVKQLKPEVLIYGFESEKCCGFFKAMVNELPYQTNCGQSVAQSLAVPTAGCNAFHTASCLIDKMVLLDDDWISTAISHLAEEEKMVIEGAGAIALSALLTKPNLLPELQEKRVVCVLTGGNVDQSLFCTSLERAKALDGRIIKVIVKLKFEDTHTRRKVIRILANLGVNIRNCYMEQLWHLDLSDYLTVVCETNDLQHAYKVKRIMNRLFPNMCEFLEEPFSPVPICACFPRSIF